MLRRLGALVIFSLTIAPPASATTGGSETVDILGWDESRSTILVSIQAGGESMTVTLFAFNLEAKRVDMATCEDCEVRTGDSGEIIFANERDPPEVLKRSSHLN